MNSLPAILAATAPVVVSGGSLVNSLVGLVVVGLIMWLVWFVISKIPMAEPIGTIVRVIFLVIVALIAINFLLSLIGHPIVSVG